MKDFILLFRQPDYDHLHLSPEAMEALKQQWQDWIGGIAAQDKLAGRGPRLSQEGKVLKAGGVITDGPFVEIRERLGGFIMIKAASEEEAITLAHGCPALASAGSVEIRAIS
ncbi:YciI family protein [Chitinophaga nivalis]|uniref:YciI family protein n=1 Tax=Chitinophaga nivalis TaxID=2991709 RepID=A0ABT3IJZ3_9BACT|nr:YciI family protein [Chitinophaga nivalis]MCW3466019.1 YciI family protein [Chitinophaga nivalis]MCW3484290.1 YciI family protein [Chitinophaga nivalis]